jgi:hypothetical protein
MISEVQIYSQQFPPSTFYSTPQQVNCLETFENKTAEPFFPARLMNPLPLQLPAFGDAAVFPDSFLAGISVSSFAAAKPSQRLLLVCAYSMISTWIKNLSLKMM